MHLHLLATGQGLPQRCVSNDQLIADKGLDSSNDWIIQRTGITQRYVCGEGESTSTLAIAAAKQALAEAKLTADDIDFILVATCTPDKTFPSVATMVHGALGARAECGALDVQAACSGFLYALSVADGLAKAGRAKTILIVGAETFSRVLDWSDRTTCVLFGDGAGAALFQAQEALGGVLDVRLRANGQQGPMLQTNGGPATTATAGTVEMQGREVFKHAVRAMGQLDTDWLALYGVTKDDIDWLIPHQANVRILQAAAEAAGVPWEKVVNTVPLHANTSGASIPLALHTARQDGRIQAGQLIYLQAFGAGFTWGEALLKL